jgi:hypothetical protein
VTEPAPRSVLDLPWWRRKRWVVMEFDAEPPPYDFVRTCARFWTRWGAHRDARRRGPSVQQLLDMDLPGRFYYGILPVPKKSRQRA